MSKQKIMELVDKHAYQNYSLGFELAKSGKTIESVTYSNEAEQYRAAIEAALPDVPADGWVGCIMVGHAKHHGGWCMFEETAPGEYDKIKGPFESKEIAETAMRSPDTALPDVPTVPEGVTVLPDGSAFAVASYPLPNDHWLYAKWEYIPGAEEPVELPTSCLERTPENYERAKLAIRYAVRSATMCGKESDFDPDALVQNALYALLGPYPQRAMLSAAPEPEPEPDYSSGDWSHVGELPAEPAQPTNRPSQQWYTDKIKETMDDDFVIGPAFAPEPEPAQAEQPTKSNCMDCANADSWGLPDKDICNSCTSGRHWVPLNTSSVNPNIPTEQPRNEPMSHEQAIAVCKKAQGKGYMPSDLKTVRATEKFHKIIRAERPECEWRWVNEKGRAMTSWRKGSPPSITTLTDKKGTMNVEIRKV